MLHRHIEQHLLRLSTQYPAITLTGPRQSGKTTLCQKLFKGHHYVNLEDLSVRQFAIEDPKGFLQQYHGGVILDEIQRAPDLPSYLQGIIDTSNQAGQFILTGSQQFEVVNNINQSLAGRTAVCRLLPLAYGELYSSEDNPKLSKILYQGFYPRIYDKDLNPTEALSFYLTTYVERDIRSLINIKDLATFERFLKLCASQIGRLVNYSQLGNDCGIDQKTVKSWLSLLEASYILYPLQPHFQNFRKRLTKSNKLYFYDVGFASFLLGITKEEQWQNHPLKGALFENFIVTEFLKNQYNNILPKNLYFFRDHMGNEVDLILEQGQGLISIEIKASATFNTQFLKGLGYYQKLAKDRNTKRYLVYAGSDAFTIKDVNVLPFWQLENVFKMIS